MLKKLFILIFLNSYVIGIYPKYNKIPTKSDYYEIKTEFPGINNVKLTLMNIERSEWNVELPYVYFISLYLTNKKRDLIEHDHKKKVTDYGYFFITISEFEKLEGELNENYQINLDNKRKEYPIEWVEFWFNFDISNDQLLWQKENGINLSWNPIMNINYVIEDIIKNENQYEGRFEIGNLCFKATWHKKKSWSIFSYFSSRSSSERSNVSSSGLSDYGLKKKND